MHLFLLWLRLFFRLLWFVRVGQVLCNRFCWVNDVYSVILFFSFYGIVSKRADGSPGGKRSILLAKSSKLSYCRCIIFKRGKKSHWLLLLVSPESALFLYMRSGRLKVSGYHGTQSCGMHSQKYN